jgi:hypothetical protein
MEIWRAITEADLLTQISGKELAAMRRVVLADSQEDPVQPSIDQITAEVRGYIAANSANKLDADLNTVPPRLIGSAVSLIIVQVMARAGGTMIDPESARSKRADEARRMLRDVAAGNFSISDPVHGTESTGVGVTVVGKRNPRVTRANLGGL